MSIPTRSLDSLLLLLLFFGIFLSPVAAQQPQPSESVTTAQPTQVSFRPSAGVVGAIFAVMFTLTLLLLLYAKLCHRQAAANIFNSDEEFGRQQQNAGVDKSFIESLPFFRFDSLRGDRDGLECAVCLSRFEDSELLRLLPKCRHAFHMNCVDQWLETNATCPLCRHRITADDAEAFKNFSISFRLPQPPDNETPPGAELDLFIEREPPPPVMTSSGGGLSGSFRKLGSFLSLTKKEDNSVLVPAENSPALDQRFMHRFKHRIIVSDVVLRSRWSDVNSADIISLNCDMLSILSSKRFVASVEPETVITPVDDEINLTKIKEELERKRVLETKASCINKPKDHNHVITGEAVIELRDHSATAGNRCMSEITNLSRFAGNIGISGSRVSDNKDQSQCRTSSSSDDRVRRAWLPIVRRTVQWFAGRERHRRVDI